MKKISVVTATRAEFGLLQPLMEQLKNDPAFQLQTVVTGAHLSPEFGNTYQQIETAGFTINAKVDMELRSDSASGIVHAMGTGLQGFSKIWEELQPDALVILGDRYEMLAVAASAVVFKIPIVHLHGGEITEGAYDDAFRHAISKLSSLHFTSTEVYRQRVIQLGETPERVFHVGALGLDVIREQQLWNAVNLEQNLGIQFKKYNYQVTFHPETLSDIPAEKQFQILLQAIAIQKDSYFIFTKANADTHGRVINTMIDDFVSKNPEISSAYPSLGNLRFLSVVQHCDALVGNSSSGIIEAPSLGTATINIGNRQKGRIQAESVINCEIQLGAILEAFEIAKSDNFKEKLQHIHNPYGNGHAAEKIMDVLRNTSFENLKIKSFYDIAF